MADDHPPSAPEATLQEPTLPISTGLPSSLAPTYPESSPPAGSETATPVVGQLLPRVNTTTRFTPTATSSTTTPIPPSPQRRLSGLISSSPLSSSSSARRRQSSLSSTISNTTEATSLDLDSGSEDCMSSEGADNVASGLGSGSGTTVGSNLPSSSSSSSLSFAQVQQHQQQQGGAASGNNNASLTSKRIPTSGSGGNGGGNLTSTAAISIPPSSVLPISISTAGPPASSVRLSTTPLFPSPLAQASGPEEDHEQSKGEDGDGESEDEGNGNRTWNRRGSPLVRENLAPFGDMDISPTLYTVGLPDVNSLGLEAALTPRPPRTAHRRSPSGRDSSPEVDVNRTARASRVRSVPRASGLPGPASGSGDEAAVNALGRRRSRQSDGGGLGGLGLDTGTRVGVGSSSSATPRPIPGSPMSSTPPSPSSSAPANSISRRTSINLVSPPRFAPSSPTTSRAPRSSLSAQFSSPVPSPFPAAPPPVESIKLQKVPEAVRSALDFRPTGALSQSVGEAFSLPTGSGSGFPGPLSSPDSKVVPKTPSATRAPSPAFGSATGSTSPSEPHSQSSSRGPSRVGSRGPSRRTSREKLPSSPLTSPVFIPGHAPTSSASSTSAFAPLFPFPSLAAPPTAPTPARTRAKSVYVPSTQGRYNISDPFHDGSEPSTSASHDFGVSPLSMGIPTTTAFGSDPSSRADHRLSTSVTQRSTGRGLLSAHRTSIAPTGPGVADTSPLTNTGGGGPDSTDEYAQIILASRSAKMRKWKTSGSSINTFDQPLKSAGGAGGTMGWVGEGSSRRAVGHLATSSITEADITSADAGDFGMATTGNKEFEWVDWLDEYRKLKEAKMKAERNGEAGGEGDDELEPMVSASLKGKGRATTAEYNPFEATTASLNQQTSPSLGFLTPEPPNHFPLTPSAAYGSSYSFVPKTTSTPTSVTTETLTRTVSNTTHSSAAGSQSASGASPGARRKRNFKLGTKIDNWWSAVRSSFSVTPEDLHERSRRTSVETGSAAPAHASLEPIASRTSSQYARPATPLPPTLRNAASAQDLNRPPVQTLPRDPFGSVVPTGALAPGARTATSRLLPPKLPHRTSSGSDADSDGNGTAKSESRWRNPNLQLSLGPSFNAMSLAKKEKTGSPSPTRWTSQQPQPQASGTDSEPLRSDSTNSASVGTSNRFFSPPVPASAASVATTEPQRSRTVAATPGLTPGHSPMWDRTPGLVPTSTHFPLRGIPAKSGKDLKASTGPQFSMHTVRQQIRTRLASAKGNCDKELRRIIQGITTHVEVELHKDLNVPSSTAATPAYDDGRFGELLGDAETMSVSYSQDAIDSESEALADVDDDVGPHTDSDGGTSRPPSRMRSPLLVPGGASPQRRRSTTASQRSGSPRRASLAPRKRHLTSVPRHSDLSSPASLVDSKSSHSANSSRSNSRSRSPLPPHARPQSTGSRSPAQTTGVDMPGSSLAQSAFIVLLQEIITVATEILDTPISKLTARPGSCAEYILRVQQIGKAWDDNPELACRGWYVQLLLAVAGLSRVIEWWEAERGFWTFDDGDDADAEPILFVAKPITEDSPEMRARGDSYSSSTAAPISLGAPKWSPLGIDLGVQSEAGDAAQQVSDADIQLDEDATQQHAEDLRQTVEEIRNSTLLMELSLDGQLFQYLSSAWQELVGLEAQECLDLPIADFVFPDDAAVFAEATRQLEADDSHTVEVSFRLRVASSSQSSQDEDSSEDLFEAMEGKGMLMLDGLSGRPSHTMWVIRPTPLSDAPTGSGQETLTRFGLDNLHRRATSDPVLPFQPNVRLSVEPVLCRICERATPVWFFEKHNETCNETHRLEGDISECNDRLKELARTVDDIAEQIDHPDAEDPAEYRGIALQLPPTADTPPTFLEGLRPPLSPSPPPHQVRKTQHRILDQVHDILQTAVSISTPSVLDETGDVPIQEQRLLSPNSENNLAAVMRWQRPVAEEPALVRLIADAEEQIRFKLNSVNRLRNTILYAEKVRQEWEAKANAVLASVRESNWETSSSPFDSPQLQPMPTDDSPRMLDALDLPRPTQGLRRHSSNLFGLASPLLSPDDGLSGLGSPPAMSAMLSPRIPSGVPSSRTKASSIKDFKILKPISKGAFGSVYLAKKITTGDYYAIKTLKKSDMVAKNQVTNVKAERMILMTQTESDFVVKLYYTFQSKDFLYLVMEYLNGGDCAALVKNLGELPEDWAKRYIAEVIVGLEYLHASGIVHRDLKPDNLLIDAKGHLKLTDFGLSRIGLLGRQTQMPTTREQRRASHTGRSASRDPNMSGTSSPAMTPANALGQSPASYFGNMTINDSFSLDTPNSEQSSQSGSLPHSHKHLAAAVDSLASSRIATSATSEPVERLADTPPQKNFVGTPDYLAPESILGIGTDAGVDWWALGVICYEFLYGVPPFSDETPEKVFANILSRRIEWHEELVEYSPEARDFMERLMCPTASKRLGAGGAAEVKAHPWLVGVDWANLLNGEVDFVPKVTDPENTEYFDPRGAADQIFAEDEHADEIGPPTREPTPARAHVPSDPPPQAATRRAARERAETAPSPHDDFGTFTFRNLTVLKQANDDVIRKMRDEQKLPPVDSPVMHARPLALGAKAPKSRTASIELRPPGPSSPSSPSTSSSSSAPSRPTAPSSPYSSNHSRRPSEAPPPAIDRLRSRQPSIGSGHHTRRNSLPSRLRASSVTDDPEELPAVPSDWSRHERRRTSAHTPPSSNLSSPVEGREPLPPLLIPALPRPGPTTLPSTTQSFSGYNPSSSTPSSISPATPFSTSTPFSSTTSASFNRTSTIDCLVAGRNPIVTKVLETMLVRLGCRCVVVPNGAEAILAAQGVAFDIIFMDLQMPVVDGETAARMIKSTNNLSSQCPIIAVCSTTSAVDAEIGTLFSGTLSKPIMKTALLSVFSKLGFCFQEKVPPGSEQRRGSVETSSLFASEDRRGSA